LKQFVGEILAGDAALIAALLRNMSAAMVAYSRSVLLNNGYSYPQAELQLDRTIAALSALCQVHSNSEVAESLEKGSVDVLKMLHNLTSQEKASLPAPIDLDIHCGQAKESSIIVLDVLVIKRSAMQSALSAISQIINVVADI